jgi:hypothetical protein
MMGKAECLAAMDYSMDWKTWRKNMCLKIARCREYGMTAKEARDWAEAIVYFLNRDIPRGTDAETFISDIWDSATPEERRQLATIIFKKADDLEERMEVPITV